MQGGLLGELAFQGVQVGDWSVGEEDPWAGEVLY